MVDVRLYGAKMDATTDDITAINAALVAGDAIIQNGTVLIGSSILGPSNRTLYLRNCKVRLANASYDNIFRNADPLNGNTNVNVICLGVVVFDGNSANNYSVNYEVFGGRTNEAQTIYKANTLFFCNTTNFKVKGVSISDRCYYAGCIQQSSYGEIEDIFFNHYNTCQNQDGIQLIYGTHHINHKRLHGRTGDDHVSIFLGTVFGTLFYPLEDFNLTGDVHHIVWDDMIIKSQYHGVIFICGDGKKIHDIVYKNAAISYNIFLTYINRSYCSIPSTKDECYNIVIDDVVVESSYSLNANVELATNMKDVTINFTNPAGRDAYRVGMKTPPYELENVLVNGVAMIGREWTDDNKPSDLTATVLADGIHLDWQNNESNISAILVYASVDNVTFTALVSNLHWNTTTYKHTVADGVLRYYKVRALCGGFSGYSNTVEATAPV